MKYYHNKTLRNTSMDDAIAKVTVALKDEGFGILTEIDVQQTLKKKIDVDFKKYKILGACNPHFAHKALSAEDKIGVFLPCNIVVQETSDNSIDVAIVDPAASMMAVDNIKLAVMASEVKEKIMRVIKSL